MVRNYETTFILKPDMEDEARENLLEKIKSIITANGGEVAEVDIWGNRRLAYEVRDFSSGFYTVISFKGEAETVNELDRNLKIMDEALRYLIIKKDK